MNPPNRRPAPVSVRLEPRLLKALKEASDREERPASFIIRRALKAHLGLGQPNRI
jgi:predicted transcriptional regulator